MIHHLWLFCIQPGCYILPLLPTVDTAATSGLVGTTTPCSCNSGSIRVADLLSCHSLEHNIITVVLLLSSSRWSLVHICACPEARLFFFLNQSSKRDPKQGLGHTRILYTVFYIVHFHLVIPQIRCVVLKFIPLTNLLHPRSLVLHGYGLDETGLKTHHIIS